MGTAIYIYGGTDILSKIPNMKGWTKSHWKHYGIEMGKESKVEICNFTIFQGLVKL